MSKELDTYITELNNFADTLPKIVNGIVVRHQFEVTDMIKIRLEGSGVDAKGGLIGGGQYSFTTLFHKEKKGAITSHFTLLDTGAFYQGMFIASQGETLLVSSRDSKTSMLESDYGEAILGLNEQETEVVAKQIIDPELQKIINKQTTFIEL